MLRIHFDCDGRFFGAVNRDYSGPGSWNGHENTLNNRFWVRSPLSFCAEKTLRSLPGCLHTGWPASDVGRSSACDRHVRRLWTATIRRALPLNPPASCQQQPHGIALQVRENSLWALVMLSTHHGVSGSAEQLHNAATALAYVVQSDANGYSAGHAMDALRRLAASALNAQGERGPLGLLRRAMAAPVLNPCPESLLRTVLPLEEEEELVEVLGGRSDGAVGEVGAESDAALMAAMR